MAVESTVRTSTFVHKIRKKHLLRSEVLVSWALFRKSSLLSPVWCKCVVIRDVVKGDKNAKRFGRFVVVAIINNNNNPAQPRVCVCCSMQLKGWFPGCWPWAGSCTLGCSNSSLARPTWTHRAAGWAGTPYIFQSYPSQTSLGYSFIKGVLLYNLVHLLLLLLTALCKLVVSSLLDSELLLVLDRSDQMSSVLSL